MKNPSGKVTEVICYVNEHPVYSGSEIGAQNAAHRAISKHIDEGRAEPEIKFVQRIVDYDLNPNDPACVTEKEISL